MADKIRTMAQALAPIADGACIAMGAFGIGSGPIALVHQLIRRGVRNLTVIGVVLGNDADLLIGAGAVRRVETSGVSLEEFGLAQNFRRFAQNGALEVGEYSEMTMYYRLIAGGAGLTFWPTRSLAGSDLTKVNPEWRELACPFTGERYTAVPAARPQYLLLHAPMADRHGNVYHPYRTDFAGFIEVAIRAADHVIVSAEQIVDDDYAVSLHRHTMMAGWKAVAVVEAPFGAHPCGLGTLYGPDADHLREYSAASRDRESFAHYLDRYVLGVQDHYGYLERIGGMARLMALRGRGTGG